VGDESFNVDHTEFKSESDANVDDVLEVAMIAVSEQKGRRHVTHVSPEMTESAHKLHMWG
jgi:hypothetical protein